MGTTLILLQKITEMFLLMGMGYILVRRKMLTDQGTADIGKLLTTAVIPLILINNLWVERSAAVPPGWRIGIQLCLLQCRLHRNSPGHRRAGQ